MLPAGFMDPISNGKEGEGRRSGMGGRAEKDTGQGQWIEQG